MNNEGAFSVTNVLYQPWDGSNDRRGKALGSHVGNPGLIANILNGSPRLTKVILSIDPGVDPEHCHH